MSGQTVISVENLGKVYRLNHRAERQRYVALRDVLTNKLKGLFRPRTRPKGSRSQEDFWALKNVSFEVKQGEVIGIIGRNGAGKSTLLKTLSRITEPSQGQVGITGRIASLLEVGTGFHPELTGRENVFLNGAILGMKRGEIKRQFDEIVAFAEVEQFLDTPVKHYSSGMYVRLAFAVAAHLEPEILVIDEVLAVGDGRFQSKCLGKMREVSTGGRTVIFVSHNMSAVKSLTARGIVLSRGRVVFDGNTTAAINAYIQTTTSANIDDKQWGQGAHTTIRAVRLLDEREETVSQYSLGQPLCIEVELTTDGTPGMSLELFLSDASGVRIGMASLFHFHDLTLPSAMGTYLCRFRFEPLWLASGPYAIEAATSVPNVNWDHIVELALQFDVPFSNPLNCKLDFKQSYGFGPLALLPLERPKFDAVNAGGD
jgi:lipopolysaccharide transport system ATP-binding protein